MRKIFVVLVLIAVCVFWISPKNVFAAISGGNQLDGTWVEEGSSPQPTFMFSGNSFKFSHHLWNERLNSTGQFVHGVNVLSGGTGGRFNTRSEREKAVGTQPSFTDDAQSPHALGPRYYFEIETTGTFSIWEDQIEFTLSDGSIEVFKFSRTENTFTIDDTRYVRQR